MPVGATLAVAGAGIGSAVIGSSAAKGAAKTESQAATNAANIQQQIYGQTRDDLAGYRALGSDASSAYARLLGLGGTGTGSTAGSSGAFQGTGLTPTGNLNIGDADYAAYVQQNPDLLAQWNQPGIKEWFGGDMGAYGKYHYTGSGQSEGRALPTAKTYSAQPNQMQAALEATPGYQFTRDQGIQEVNRSLGSRGLTGAQAKGIARFVTGLADKTYGDTVSRLQGATTIGANAAAGGGQIGAQTGANIGNNIVGAGQASAAGTVGAANAINSSLGSLGQYAYANRILGMYGSGGAPSPSGNIPPAFDGLY